jgi:RNA-directed DNA polymerase
MLEALNSGVKGGKWYSLADKVYREANLRAAWEQVRRNKGAPGVDYVTIEQFERRLEDNLGRIAADLRSESYAPQAIRRVFIPKPGRPGEERPLGIPTVRDRVVQAAVRNVLEPIFEAGFAEHSYGFRPKRGAKDALRRVRKGIDRGGVHVVDADLKSYFDTIPHDRMMARLEEKVSDHKVLGLIDGWLHQKIMEDAAEWTPTMGSPQGAVISPLLANIYLDELDHLVANAGLEMVRYADDFVILCRSRADAENALDLVRQWTASAGLTLHPEKTRLVDLTAGESFDFLGYNFQLGQHWMSNRSHRRIRDRVRELTPRSSGKSLRATIEVLNRTLRGWFQYFRHINAWMLGRLDAWVRTRLRGILWRFRGGKGYPKGGPVTKRWPNAYFTRNGLFSLHQAHREETAQQRLPLQSTRW